MRENKFRAWDGWALGFTYSDKECDYYVWGFEEGKLKAWVLNETVGTTDEPPGVESVELELPDECIGLKDKNGKEIYERDIVHITAHMINFNAPVVFHGGAFKASTLSPGDFPNGGKRSEIIGNMYENPELLEEEAAGRERMEK